MKKQLIILVAVCVFFSYAISAAGALTFDEITFWVGEGDMQAALVIDWNDGISPQSLVWGYRWNGTATGEDMLKAVEAADSALEVSAADYGFGIFVTGMSYAGIHAQFSDDYNYWAYWEDDVSQGANWISSPTGASGRTLLDGSWDGWSYTGWDDNWNPLYSPAAPVNAAVPEPSSLAALMMGAVSLGGYALRRRAK